MKKIAFTFMALGYIALFSEPEKAKTDAYLIAAMILFATSIIIGLHASKPKLTSK